MVRHHRDNQKRRIAYCLGCLQRAFEHALELKGEFDNVIGIDVDADDYVEQLINAMPDKPHAKYAIILHTAIMQLSQADSSFREFARLAWGEVPANLSQWIAGSTDNNNDDSQ